MVLTLLSDDEISSNNNLFSKIISFAICLLKNGNKIVQNTFYQYFISHQKSELIFRKFHKVIRNEILSIENVSKNLNSEQNSINGLKIQDKKIFSKIILRVNSTKEAIILNKILKLMQLLCEGHYQEIQSYFGKQTNSKNSYDLIIAVVDLLKVYYYNSLCKGLYKNINYCLKTIIEFVQGPCPQNQIAVADSNFFDIVKDLFKVKNKNLIL